MTAPSAGWYPDPSDPRRLRWWTGIGWTDATTPWVPEGGASPPSGGSHDGFPAWGALLAAVGVCSVVALAAVAAVNAGDDSMTCEKLAYEAVAFAQESSATRLVLVEDVTLAEDHQREPARATDQHDALLLACDGTGTWDDGFVGPVRVKLTVDPEGRQRIDAESR